MIALGTISIMVLLTMLKYEEIRSSEWKISDRFYVIKCFVPTY